LISEPNGQIIVHEAQMTDPDRMLNKVKTIMATKLMNKRLLKSKPGAA